MKIDVEGAELDVLRGAYQTLIKNFDIVLLIDIHPMLGVKPIEICNFLKKLGFSIYSMEESHKQIENINKNLGEIFAKRPSNSR